MELETAIEADEASLQKSPGMLRSVLSMLERLTVELSTARLAVSQSLAGRYYALGLAGRLRRPITVLGRGSSKGVNVSRFALAGEGGAARREARERWGIAEDVPVIGLVGRIHADKGLRDLSEASRLLAEDGTAHRVAVIGGSEDSELEAELARNPNIVLVGRSESLERDYPGMDVFCLPTHREGFPNVVLEASAAGLPVLATDATGAVDSVEDGITGLIVKAQDPEHLAKGLGWMLRHPGQAKEMGAAGARHVAENFEESTVVGKLADWLEELDR